MSKNAIFLYKDKTCKTGKTGKICKTCKLLKEKTCNRKVVGSNPGTGCYLNFTPSICQMGHIKNKEMIKTSHHHLFKYFKMYIETITQEGNNIIYSSTKVNVENKRLIFKMIYSQNRLRMSYKKILMFLNRDQFFPNK